MAKKTDADVSAGTESPKAVADGLVRMTRAAPAAVQAAAHSTVEHHLKDEEGLVTVTRVVPGQEDETLDVHPSCVAAHLEVGFKVA